MDGMALEDYEKHCDTNRTTVKEMLELAKSYNKVNIIISINYTVYCYNNMYMFLLIGFGR